MACAFGRQLRAKDLLGDRQPMSEINHDHDEFAWLELHMDIGRPCQIPKELTPVSNLLPMHLDKTLSNTLASKSSGLKFSAKDDPVTVRDQVRDRIPHFL